MAKRVVDNLRISEKDLHAIIARYEHSVGDSTKGLASLRRSRRWDWHTLEIVVSRFNEFGEKTHFAAYARNISQDGLAFIHGAYIHAGITCTITIRSLKGNPVKIDAVVRRCSHIKGHLHDVGIQFERQIDPAAFIDFGDKAAVNIENVDVTDLTGTVLYIEDNLADQKLFGHHLRNSSLDILYASEIDTGLSMLSEDPDLIFVDFRLGDRDGVEFIKKAREQAFEKTIILVTAETDADVRMSAMAAGAKCIVRKPYTANLLQCAVAEALTGGTDSSGEYGPLYSDLEACGMDREMVEEYVHLLRKHAKAIIDANESGDGAQVYELTQQIRGSAASYGFPPITEIATKLMEQMGADHNLKWAYASILKLVSACRRASLPPDVPKTEAA